MTTVAQPTKNGRPMQEDPWADEPPRLADALPAAAAGRKRWDKPPLPSYELSFRKPTGRTGYPLVFLTGGEYSGKSTMAVELANDSRVGETWMLHLGEDIDWLGAIADFDVVEHNGEWWQIYGAALAMRDRAKAIRENGGPVPLIIIDSESKIHELLSTWAENRARTNDENYRKLLMDPNAEVQIGHAHWNPANKRHRQLVNVLLTTPAIKVVTARGKMVTAFDKATGKPIANTKEYSVMANNEMGYATTAWIRLEQGTHPKIHGIRMPKYGIRPGLDQPRVMDPEKIAAIKDTGFTLSWLIFDVLKFDPGTAEISRVVEPVADSSPDDAPRPPAQQAAPADADEAPGKDAGDETHPAVAVQGDTSGHPQGDTSGHPTVAAADAAVDAPTLPQAAADFRAGKLETPGGYAAVMIENLNAALPTVATDTAAPLTAEGVTTT